MQRRRRTRLLTPKGAFLIAADHLITRDIAAPARKELRKRLATLLKEKPIRIRREACGSLLRFAHDDRLQVGVGQRGQTTFGAQFGAHLDRRRRRCPGQAGAATIRVTRILVRPIASALQRAGDRRHELIEDYGLSQEQIAAARVYADARPQRGRPSISVSGEIAFDAILIDENLSPMLVELARERAYEAMEVRDLEIRRARLPPCGMASKSQSFIASPSLWKPPTLFLNRVRGQARTPS